MEGQKGSRFRPYGCTTPKYASGVEKVTPSWNRGYRLAPEEEVKVFLKNALRRGEPVEGIAYPSDAKWLYERWAPFDLPVCLSFLTSWLAMCCHTCDSLDTEFHEYIPRMMERLGPNVSILSSF